VVANAASRCRRPVMSTDRVSASGRWAGSRGWASASSARIRTAMPCSAVQPLPLKVIGVSGGRSAAARKPRRRPAGSVLETSRIVASALIPRVSSVRSTGAPLPALPATVHPAADPRR
jgi:hypothetical protein